MEILIPGLILVALMVYASTRIKRSAAKALEREEIKASGFSITKPDGFIHVLNGDPQLAFESYTREFGTEGADEVRQATAVVRVSNGSNSGEISEQAASGLSDVRTESIDGTTWISGYLDEKGVTMEIVHKIVAKGGLVYDLRVAAINDFSDDLSAKVNEMLESFAVE
jgi:hypothetical protein